MTTPKHLENFKCGQVLTGDDDSADAETIQFWLTDDFFKEYGWAFVESGSSTPTAQKGHPTLIFDRPVTDIDMWRLCLQAFAWRYEERVDRAMTNPVCTFYNRRDASIHLVGAMGNLCPLPVYMDAVVRPYLLHGAEKQRRRVAEMDQPDWRRTVSSDSADDPELRRANAWVQAAIHNLLREVATSREGERHITLRDKSKRAGHLLAADWHDLHLPQVEQMLLRAAAHCGYVADDGEQVARNTIRSGLALGRQRPAPVPETLVAVNPVRKREESGHLTTA